MRGFVLRLLILAGLVLAFASPRPAAQDPMAPVVVVLRASADPDAVAAEHARDHGSRVAFVYRFALRGYAATVPLHRVSLLRADPRVAFLEPDREVRAHLFPQAMTAVGQVLPTGVNRINAERKANTGSGAHVAILDTGIDTGHPDLAANLAGGVNCSSGTSFDDPNGHGTHVAGTVAALNNGFGVVGVAPGAKLWAIRVLNKAGVGSTSSLLCGLDAVDARSPVRGGPIVVANASLGSSGIDDGNCGRNAGDALHLAICTIVADGVTVVASAGNEAADLRFTVPAAYEEVIAVSALADSDGRACGAGTATTYGPDDTFATFSNFASSADLAHLVAAPGVGIRSTYKGSTYATLSGTSMAAPHVAGSAALYLAAHPGASPAEVLAALQATGEPAGVSFGGECSAGASHTDPSGMHPERVVRADTL